MYYGTRFLIFTCETEAFVIKVDCSFGCLCNSSPSSTELLLRLLVHFPSGIIGTSAILESGLLISAHSVQRVRMFLTPSSTATKQWLYSTDKCGSLCSFNLSLTNTATTGWATFLFDKHHFIHDSKYTVQLALNLKHANASQVCIS